MVIVVGMEPTPLLAIQAVPSQTSNDSAAGSYRSVPRSDVALQAVKLSPGSKACAPIVAIILPVALIDEKVELPPTAISKFVSA